MAAKLIRFQFVLMTLLYVMSSSVCHAARQEQSISKMVTSLHHEYKLKWEGIRKNRQKVRQELLKMDTLINRCCDDSRQCAITVYSTDDNSFQDMAFASQNALAQYRDFGRWTSSYTSMLRDYRLAAHRQDSLRKVLTGLDTSRLTPKARKILPGAIALVDSIQGYNTGVLRHLDGLYPRYRDAYHRFEQATKTCERKYEIIRSNVLYNLNDNIIDIVADWDGYIRRMDESKELRWSIDDSRNVNGTLSSISQGEADNMSEWGAMRIVGVCIILIAFVVVAVFVALAVCLIRWILKRLLMLRFWSRTRLADVVANVLNGIRYVSGIRYFALVSVWTNVIEWILIYFTANGDNNGGADVGDSLLAEIFYFNSLVAIITTFFMLRYSRREFWRSLFVCIPTLLAALYSFFSVVMVMPDAEIVVEVPFVTMGLFVLQLLIWWRCHRHLDEMMARISVLSLIFLGLSMVIALLGLQYLSTMVVAFWCSFMLCMIILKSSKHFLDRLIEKHRLADRTVKRTWWIPVFNRVLYPMAWVYAVLWSCQMACIIYSLDGLLSQLLHTYFKTPLGNISINIDLLIFICWNILLAAYLSKIIYQFVDYYHRTNGNESWKDTSILNQNTIRILVWGLAIVNVMIRMGFSMQWVGYCMAGVSTGLGFASREILENLIYGITLRNGQLKIGDWIVCEGIRGQIKSIGLLSTRMESVEGSVITFTNGRLLNMNYENITLNHGYELLHTHFSIVNGEDIEKVRRLLIDGYKHYDCYDKGRQITVYFRQIDNSQIDLDFRVWIPAADRIRLTAFNLEYVYRTLHENGIRYPYPYMEIHNT